MGSESPLTERSVLIVEDDPLIRLELIDLFQSVGARAIAASTCDQAVEATAQYHICAALLDYMVGEDSVAQLCRELSEYQIPYMFYTGYPDLEQVFPGAVIVEKPASGEALIGCMTDLIVSSLPNRGRLRCKGPAAQQP